VVDIVDQATRSRMMSKIKGKDTRPELVVRRALHRLGYRYRLHRKDLPGRPDMIFPSCKAVIFVNGCFWHAHDCGLFRLPKTHTGFWKNKISKNVERDKKNIQLLKEQGWRVLIVWECSIKRKKDEDISGVIRSICDWLESPSVFFEIKG